MSTGHVRTRDVHSPHLKEIMSCPPTTQSLAIDVDGECQQAKEDGGSAKHIHDLLRTVTDDPRVGKVGQGVKHKVLEEHVHDEGLRGDGTECVQTVGNGTEDGNKDTEHHQTLAEGAKSSGSSDGHEVSEQEHSNTRSGHRNDLENETEFGLTVS